MLVSRKVGYDDVWDLRNAGDALESGRKSKNPMTGDDWHKYFNENMDQKMLLGKVPLFKTL